MSEQKVSASIGAAVNKGVDKYIVTPMTTKALQPSQTSRGRVPPPPTPMQWNPVKKSSSLNEKKGLPPELPPYPKINREQSGLLHRIATCYGVSTQKAVQIRDLVENSGILGEPDKLSLIKEEVDSGKHANFASSSGKQQKQEQQHEPSRMQHANHITLSTTNNKSVPMLSSTSTRGITEMMTMDDYVSRAGANRSEHDLRLNQRETSTDRMSAFQNTSREHIFELLQLLRTPNTVEKTERRISQLVDILADESWTVPAWCDTVFYADKTNRVQIRDRISRLRVKFVASSAAESGVLGNTEQLYMVKRIPRDMIQNTGLRKDPLVKAPSNHGKVRNGAIVRIGTPLVRPTADDDNDPVIYDQTAKFVFIQLLSEQKVHGYIRLNHLHPYRLVNLHDCPDSLSGELRRKSTVMSSRCYFRLKNGVLDCYSDAVRQKLLSRYYLDTVMYAYQAEKDDTLIHLKFKRTERKPSRRASIGKAPRVSIGKSITLKARNGNEARLWTESIGMHCAWLNWQTQLEPQSPVTRKGSTYVSLQRLYNGESPVSEAPLRILRPKTSLKWTYDKSLFKKCYAAASAPNTVLDVLQPLNAMIVLFAEMCGIPDHRTVAEAFYRRLEYEIFEVREAHKQVDNVCQRLWTSALHLESISSESDDSDYSFTTVGTTTARPTSAIPSAIPFPDNFKLELCSIINRTLQKDGALSPSVSLDQRRRLLEHVAVICRGINTIRAAGSDHEKELVRAGSMYIRSQKHTPFPPGGVTWRGGGFRPEFKEFFVKGVKFRAPCYLATSFRKEIAEEFRRNAAARGYETIMWRIEVDPEGVTNPNRRCFQANYVRKTVLGLPDEQEFLFSQFAPFQVKEVNWSDNPRVKPHEVTLYALQDGRKESEDLPLSPWN